MKTILLLILLTFTNFAFGMNKPPIQTIQSSTNYTIPANKWARVVVTAWEGGSFAINSVQVLNTVQKTWSVLGSSVVGAVNSKMAVETSFSPAGNAFTSTNANMTTNITQYYYVKSGDVVACTGNCRLHIEVYNY